MFLLVDRAKSLTENQEEQKYSTSRNGLSQAGDRRQQARQSCIGFAPVAEKGGLWPIQ